MLSFKKILCPTDFSEPSRAALDAAAELAMRNHADLYLVHVVPVVPTLPPDPNFLLAVPEYERALHADAQRQLDLLRAEMMTMGLEVQVIVGHGSAAHEIVRVANDEKVDLIVIATHGTTGWEHAMFGSVAEKVVQLAKRPVLTIPAAMAASV